MSVQFGRWNFEGQPPAQDYLERVSATLASYGPDSNESYARDGLQVLYRAFHTTQESRGETQPHIPASGVVITWDGRLDNRAELISELSTHVTIAATDVIIVAAAYERWGTQCFAKLIGDWALSIWNPANRSLTLAKDPIGARHLYYTIDNHQVIWSTILDPLILFAGKTFTICEEYIAGWLTTMFPAAHLTPYIDIHAVPPSSFVLLGPSKHAICRYWDFDPGKRIHYHTDAGYEEHFRSVFATAVGRRLRADRPVLAELSGGMDSSSIVCMADLLIARGVAGSPRLDTISWYDDTYDSIQPDMNELPYFTKVEQKRGRTGYHINFASLDDTSQQEPIELAFESDRFAATPTPNRYTSELFKRYAAHMVLRGHRVTLSGIGGGALTGDGVPTPTPEFQDLLARGRFFALTRRLNTWAARMRAPRMLLLREAVRGFFPVNVGRTHRNINPVAPWFHSAFVRRNRATLCGDPCRLNLFAPLPSFQEGIRRLQRDRRFLADSGLHPDLLREVRLPYFDRDLLEFMYAIPREQIVRPGQRRSLMKRALVGIVPDELLKRRRKAFIPQAPNQQDPQELSSAKWPSALEIGSQTVSGSAQLIDSDRFLDTLQKARRGEEVPIDSLKSTLTLEFWLRHLMIRGVLTTPLSTKRRNGCHHPKPSGVSLLAKDYGLQSACAAQKVQLASSWKEKSQKKGGEDREIRNSETDGIDARDRCHSGQWFGQQGKFR